MSRGKYLVDLATKKNTDKDIDKDFQSKIYNQQEPTLLTPIGGEDIDKDLDQSMTYNLQEPTLLSPTRGEDIDKDLDQSMTYNLQEPTLLSPTGGEDIDKDLDQSMTYNLQEQTLLSPTGGEDIDKDLDQSMTCNLPEPTTLLSLTGGGVHVWSEETDTSDTGNLLTGSESNNIVINIDVPVILTDDPKVLDGLQHGKIIYEEPAIVNKHNLTVLEDKENIDANSVQDTIFNISGLTDVLNNNDLINTKEDEGIQLNDPDWTPDLDNSYHSDKSESEKSEWNFENINNEEHVINEIEVNTERKTRGRKRKFPEQNKEIAKKRKNSNLSYFNSKGTLQEKKQFIDVQCSCKLKCNESISEEMRRTEYERFWELADYDAQNLYITSCVKEGEKKRIYGRDPTKRTFSRVYKLRNIPVCRQMFTCTLRISSKRVNTALVKMRSNVLKDRRGSNQGGKNQLTDDKINYVKEQINKIPKYKSHYRRENNDSDFLPPEMTLQKMYDKYIEEKIEKCSLQKECDIRKFRCATQEERKEIIKKIDAVSFSSYRKIFLNDFNLKFKTLKKDTCNTCDSFAARIKSASGEEKIELQEQHNKHLDLANEARQQLKEDGKQAKQNNKLECLTFDLEKTLPLPRIPTNIIFYKRQLWFYNAGVHSMGSERGFCYVWTEAEAGRGAQEIGSCILKHIGNYVGREVEDLVLWSDSCGGQNRNVKIVLILKACLESHPSLKTITLKFLMPGHSFLPNDADFSDIESALKNVQRLYLPQDYIQVIENCRRKKPFCVTKMEKTDFIGTANLEKKIVNRKQTDEDRPKKINWLKFREIHLKKEEPMKIFCRTDFTSTYDAINIEKSKTKGRKSFDPQLSFKDSLIPLWPTGKEIALPKLKDLKSILHLIPSDAKPFYQALQGDRSVIDDIDGYCGPLDFELEDDRMV